MIRSLCAIALLVGSVVTAGAQTAPPVSADDVGAAIFGAGGPNLGGLLKTVAVDPKNPNSRDFWVGLDAAGRPIAGPPYVYEFSIHLSYIRDGSGGFAWVCSMQVWKLLGRIAELTNAADNMLSLAQFESLLAGRPSHAAFSDPRTVKSFDKSLDRTPQEAIAKAFRKLNAGTTGVVRTQMLR